MSSARQLHRLLVTALHGADLESGSLGLRLVLRGRCSQVWGQQLPQLPADVYSPARKPSLPSSFRITHLGGPQNPGALSPDESVRLWAWPRLQHFLEAPGNPCMCGQSGVRCPRQAGLGLVAVTPGPSTHLLEVGKSPVRPVMAPQQQGK